MRFSRHTVINFFVNHSGIFGRRMVEGNGSGGRRMERNLGEMPSTFRGDLSAYNLWIAYRTSRGVPVHTSKQELSGDNAEDLILDLCRFASTRAIPIKFRGRSAKL